jgi:hypothetical protein
MNINCNYESKLRVYPDISSYKICDINNSYYVYFKSVDEKSFNMDNNINYSFPKNIIEKYFDNSIENFDTIVRFMLKPIDPDLLRFELLDIVKKYDENYIIWVNTVYEKILNFKN